MLAGLIRDEERTVLAGVPGLIDLPLIGRLFARNKKESLQTDIILTLTPHIVRTLDVTEADLRPFRTGPERRDGGGVTPVERPGIQQPPRDPGGIMPGGSTPAGAGRCRIPAAAAADAAGHDRAGDAAEETGRRSRSVADADHGSRHGTQIT